MTEEKAGMPKRIEVGDYVRYRLESGIDGKCLLVEERRSFSEPKRRMFFGQLWGTSTIHLYEDDVTEILNGGVKQWRG